MGDTREPAGSAVPLLIACALGIEKLALRAGGAAGDVTILRTGMGPVNAGRPECTRGTWWSWTR
jgi:hypothetical protein